MHFFVSRPKMDSIIIEANSIEELKFQALGHAEFNEDDLEKVFKEKRRNRYYSNDDRNFSILRLIKSQLKNIRTKLCLKCLENDSHIYIHDDATMCDNHLLEKYDLIKHMTYDTADCLGMEELLPAEEVIKVLRRLDK